jgi:ribose/xylose/arabinose/galactoside ABC-type transport system permease subunit
VRAHGSSLILVGIFVAFVLAQFVTNPAFGRAANIANVPQQNSIIGIIACGMLLMIVVGGFDLSVGAVGGMTSVLARVEARPRPPHSRATPTIAGVNSSRGDRGDG